jgi:hypothetical protein
VFFGEIHARGSFMRISAFIVAAGLCSLLAACGAPPEGQDDFKNRSLDDDGCPANMSLADDGLCYCDEGYALNADMTGCEASAGTTGGPAGGGDTGGNTGGNTGGDTGGNTGGDTGGNTGGDTGGDTGGGTDDGCPPNSHREGDSCFCDEGFVVNDTQDACILGGDTGGGSGGNGGCPPNSSPEGDTCYCDEGYVVNAAGTGCELGSGGGSGGGGSGGCPPNSHLEGDACYCDEGFIVNSDQSACVHECESNAQCGSGLVCSDFQCIEPPCTPGSCGAGMLCSDSGRCVVDIGSPPTGTIPSCPNVPDWYCDGTESSCGALTVFNPRSGDGYWDYPLNGETSNNQYRSYVRKDTMMLVKYAASATSCLGQHWTVGNGGRLGLGDMSEADGAIPGTSDGQPGHPAGTHVDGHDMDIAYFQVGTPDNTLRSVCDHVSGGYDQYHCVNEPDDLDVWRTAMFIGKMHDSPQLRVVGVDGKIGPLVESAVDQLCAGGWLSGDACNGNLALAYEVTDGGAGWYRFHHHHLHMSMLSRTQVGWAQTHPELLENIRKCFTQDCQGVDLASDPRHLLYRPLRPRLLVAPNQVMP